MTKQDEDKLIKAIRENREASVMVLYEILHNIDGKLKLSNDVLESIFIK